MTPDLAEEVRRADPETRGKFQTLLDRLRHLNPSPEVQRKLLHGLLERRKDEGWIIGQPFPRCRDGA
jgi:hypothetical protein